MKSTLADIPTPEERARLDRICELIRSQSEGWQSEVSRFLKESEPISTVEESEHIRSPMGRVFQRYLVPGARPQDSIITTGFPDLDRMVSFEPGALVIVGAHSGHGKSSLSMQFAFHVGCTHGATLYFTSEMDNEQLTLRLACTLAKVDSKRVRRGLLGEPEFHRLTDVAKKVDKSLCWMRDKGGDVRAIRAVCKREVARIEQQSGKKVRLVVVDYLQRVPAGKAAPAGANREQQVAAVARELKETAMELGVCVIAPSQLNEDSSKRPNARPTAADVRESRGILNEADVVLLVHNPNYQARCDAEDAKLDELEPCELILGKGRSDGNGSTSVWFTPMYTRFDSMSDEDKALQRDLRERAREAMGKGRKGRGFGYGS